MLVVPLLPAEVKGKFGCRGIEMLLISWAVQVMEGEKGNGGTLEVQGDGCSSRGWPKEGPPSSISQEHAQVSFCLEIRPS